MFHPLPRMINFSNFFITPPKPFQLSLGVAGKRNTDFVSFVTILPIFTAKRPDYRGDARCWQPLKERTWIFHFLRKIFVRIFKENRVEYYLGNLGKVQVMIDAPFDSRVYWSIRECIDRFEKVLFDANVMSKRVKVKKCRSIPQIVIRFD